MYRAAYEPHLAHNGFMNTGGEILSNQSLPRMTSAGRARTVFDAVWPSTVVLDLIDNDGEMAQANHGDSQPCAGVLRKRGGRSNRLPRAAAPDWHLRDDFDPSVLNIQ